MIALYHFTYSFRKFGRTLKGSFDRMRISWQAACWLMHWRGTRGLSSSSWRSLTALSALMLRVAAKFASTLHFKMLCCSTWTVASGSTWAASPLPPSAFALYLSAQYRLPPPLIFLERSSQGAFNLCVIQCTPLPLIRRQVLEGFGSN